MDNPVNAVPLIKREGRFLMMWIDTRSGRRPDPDQKQHRLCVFHASSTAPVPQTAEGAVGEGWKTQLAPGLIGAMFDPERPLQGNG